MLAADIVVGIGRVVVEGMATGRACLVLDETGGGAWLTPETYAQFKAYFLGPGLGVAPDDLGSLIDGYRAEYGRAGREDWRSRITRRPRTPRVWSRCCARPARHEGRSSPPHCWPRPGGAASATRVLRGADRRTGRPPCGGAS